MNKLPSGKAGAVQSRDPTAVRKMHHDTAVEATRRAQVQILDAGVLAQGRELEPRGKLFAVTLSGLAVNQNARRSSKERSSKAVDLRCSSSALAMPVRPRARSRSWMGWVSILVLSQW